MTNQQKATIYPVSISTNTYCPAEGRSPRGSYRGNTQKAIFLHSASVLEIGISQSALAEATHLRSPRSDSWGGEDRLRLGLSWVQLPLAIPSQKYAMRGGEEIRAFTLEKKSRLRDPPLAASLAGRARWEQTILRLAARHGKHVCQKHMLAGFGTALGFGLSLEANESTRKQAGIYRISGIP